MTHDVHLVGSVPLSSAKKVFIAASDALGPRLKRIPDGETGERSLWLGWLGPVFAERQKQERGDLNFERDLHRGAISLQRARENYGVTFDADGSVRRG